MKFTQLTLILTLLLFGCNSTRNISKVKTEINQNNDYIDYLFKEYKGEKPSASVVVIKDGKIEFIKSYGYADLEKRIIATPKTNYRIASVTKQFTATAIMILVNQGKLTYETKLTEIFPTFPSYGDEITIRQLLTHRSGLVRYNRFIDENRTEQMLDKDVLNGLLKTDSTYFQPNAKFAYSNTGYAVLAQIIEKISKVSFADFIEREIFLPLNMPHSTVIEKDKSINNRAFGYLVKDTLITLKDQSMTSAIQGDGGIYSSVFDYFKWDQGLYSEKLISKEELEYAFYNYDVNGKSNEEGYGFGWVINYYKDVKILEHGGSSTGFGSHVIRIPSKNISVAIFTNRNKKGKELKKKAEALINLFTKGEFQMPFEIVLEKEFSQNGINKGIELLYSIKKDTINYTISKGAIFMFGISYINKNRNDIAIELFKVLENDYPKYFGGYYGSAVVYQQENNIEKALVYYKKTIQYCNKKEKWALDRSQKMMKELTQ